MKVRFYGFSIACDSHVTMEQFFKEVAKLSKSKSKIGAHERLFFLNSDQSKKYHTGLFITIKDQRKFCELIENAGKMTITVNDLKEDNSLMDFNFFVINKKTGFGLYQHYHNSFSLNQFCFFLKRKYNAMNKRLCSEEKKLLPTLTPKEEKKINKKYQGSLEWEFLVRKESLGEILKELESIRALEIDFAYLQAEEEEFVPLSDYVTKERKRISFTPKSPTQMLRDGIVSIINKADIKDGRIFGRDVDGIDRIVRVFENLDNFGEYEFDTVASNLNALDMDNFEKCWVVKTLLQSCKDNKHIFNAKIK